MGVVAVVVFAVVCGAVYYIATASSRRSKNKINEGVIPDPSPKDDKR